MPRDTRVIRSVIPMQPPDKPMTPLADAVFDLGVTLNRITAATQENISPYAEPPLEFAKMGSLSLVAFRIAKDLAEAAAIEVGAEPLPWEELTSVARERFRYLAERAIATLDPDKRVAAAREAIEDTAEWENGLFGGRGTEPDVADIARHAIHQFEQRLFEKVGQP